MKICQTCKKDKSFSDFFCDERDSERTLTPLMVGNHCKQCHEEGKVQHGYGWYGDKYKTPEDTVALAF